MYRVMGLDYSEPAVEESYFPFPVLYDLQFTVRIEILATSDTTTDTITLTTGCEVHCPVTKNSGGQVYM